MKLLINLYMIHHIYARHVTSRMMQQSCSNKAMEHVTRRLAIWAHHTWEKHYAAVYCICIHEDWYSSLSTAYFNGHSVDQSALLIHI